MFLDPLATVGAATRRRELENSLNQGYDRDIVLEGNKSAHEGSSLADRRKFAKRYGVNPAAVLSNRAFSKFLDILNWNYLMTAPMPSRMNRDTWQELANQFRATFLQILDKMTPPGKMTTDVAFDEDIKCKAMYEVLKNCCEPVAEEHRKLR
jgi:hypothetical protein